MMTPLLELKGVSKAFSTGEDEVVLFRDLNWTLSRGGVAAIVGESGSGKTTLLHLAATLDRPDQGDILLSGVPTAGLSETALASVRSRQLGLVFQFHFLLKEFTVLENVALPAWLTGVSREESWERAKDLIAQVGLSHRERSFPHQLSGGERQRTALARALVNNPPLLLADEPTGNLDPKHSQVVQDLLLSLVEKEKKTLLLVTHDEEFAKRTGSIFRLTGGRLEQE